MAEQRNETVLPSGAFATVRTLKGEDLLEANRILVRTGQDMAFTLMSLSMTVDGKPVTYRQLVEMDIRDVLVLQQILSPYLTGAIRSTRSDGG